MRRYFFLTCNYTGSRKHIYLYNIVWKYFVNYVLIIQKKNAKVKELIKKKSQLTFIIKFTHYMRTFSQMLLNACDHVVIALLRYFESGQSQ